MKKLFKQLISFLINGSELQPDKDYCKLYSNF